MSKIKVNGGVVKPGLRGEINIESPTQVEVGETEIKKEKVPVVEEREQDGSIV